ncbi:MAG: hypothetical protein DRJ47_08610 [Thermoprotei archaeon]|nr:MAG: hypothetical protein DRJ47_08610 [Thermoprotei archaeon]
MQKVSVKSVRIENFLSIRNVRIELGKLNVFIGPNASGKSNLVKALKLVANHVNNGLPSLAGYERFKELVHGFDETKKIIIEIETSVGERTAKYILALMAENYTEKVLLDDVEVLVSDGKTHTAEYLTTSGTTGRFDRFERSSTNIFAGKGSYYPSAFTRLPGDAVKELHELAAFLRGISVYSFTPKYIRARSNVGEKPVMNYYGGALARVILHLYLENRRVFSEIEDAFKSAVPEVEEVVPHLEGNMVEIWLRVKGLTEPLKPHNISDGTLRLLAFITGLHMSRGIVAFEEPENCIHPHLLETLVDLARRAASQVLVTTHSPYLLDHVKPEEVYIVEKVGVETRVKRLRDAKEVEQVARFLEEGGTLGEAWYSGIFGGNP